MTPAEWEKELQRMATEVPRKAVAEVQQVAERKAQQAGMAATTLGGQTSVKVTKTSTGAVVSIRGTTPGMVDTSAIARQAGEAVGRAVR